MQEWEYICVQNLTSYRAMKEILRNTTALDVHGEESEDRKLLMKLLSKLEKDAHQRIR